MTEPAATEPTPIEPRPSVPPPYRHVVVGVDGSEGADRAARSARVLADALGAALHLLRADLGLDDVSPSVAAWVEASAADLGATPHTVPLGQAPGHPARLLLEQVAALPDAVACLGSRGRGAVGAALLGSTTSDYLARSGRPALLYGPEGASMVPPQRVALCADGSSHAADLLGEALRWAVGLSVPLVVVTAASDARAAPPDAAAALVEGLAGAPEASAAPVSGTVVRGHDPRAALLGFLKAEPTLTVLATHGQSALAATMLGGTAGAVVRNATGPLVLQRPPSLSGSAAWGPGAGAGAAPAPDSP